LGGGEGHAEVEPRVISAKRAGLNAPVRTTVFPVAPASALAVSVIVSVPRMTAIRAGHLLRGDLRETLRHRRYQLQCDEIGSAVLI
jgi:hypothetical protein